MTTTIDKSDLQRRMHGALAEFAGRQRRFGGR